MVGILPCRGWECVVGCWCIFRGRRAMYVCKRVEINLYDYIDYIYMYLFNYIYIYIYKYIYITVI